MPGPVSGDPPLFPEPAQPPPAPAEAPPLDAPQELPPTTPFNDGGRTVDQSPHGDRLVA